MADPEKLRPGFNLTAAGMYVNGPGPGRIGVVEFDGAGFDRATTITRESLQEILRRVSGSDVTIAALHVASTSLIVQGRRQRIEKAVCCWPAMLRMCIPHSEGKA